MSTGMLGVSEVKGVIADLLEKLSGDECRMWLTALKRLLRKENPWEGIPGMNTHAFPKGIISISDAEGVLLPGAKLRFPKGSVVCRVKVDRTRTPMEVINATGRVLHVNHDVVATMPQGEGDEVDVYFIPTKRLVLASEVSAFLAQYGLVPDPRAQAAVNEQDPAFADEHPNGTQWGNNCCLTFHRWNDGGRGVGCGRFGGRAWLDNWFLVGVPAPRK